MLPSPTITAFLQFTIENQTHKEVLPMSRKPYKPHNSDVIVEARKLLKDLAELAGISDGLATQVESFLEKTERFEKAE